MAPRAIPDRWQCYTVCGRVIEGTRIICFKVPLRERVQMNNSQIDEIWDIKALLKKIPKLGAVMDLTNTSRYYDPKDLQAAGVLHSKISMSGGEIPPERQVKLFMDTVDEFLGKDRDFLIGVHCTHGLNRTGYMVCRYLIDRMKIPATEAIEMFEKARGYKIERKNYIANLAGKLSCRLSSDSSKHTKVTAYGRDNMSYRSPLDPCETDKYSMSRSGEGRYIWQGNSSSTRDE